MRRIIILLSLLTWAVNISADEKISADSLFSSIPEELFSSINDNGVLMLDSTDDYLCVSIAQSSTLQMKIMPGNTICVVKTYKAPEADSEVYLYNMKWEKIGEQTFGLNNFFDEKNDSSSLEKARILFQPLLIEASLSKDTDELQLQINPVMLSDEELASVNSDKLQTTLKWDGKMFK